MIYFVLKDSTETNGLDGSVAYTVNDRLIVQSE